MTDVPQTRRVRGSYLFVLMTVLAVAAVVLAVVVAVGLAHATVEWWAWFAAHYSH